MNNVRLHQALLIFTAISWLIFLALLVLTYWKPSYIWGMFAALLTACIFTVMLSRFRSKDE